MVKKDKLPPSVCAALAMSSMTPTTSEREARDAFDEWHDATYPEPEYYHHKVSWRGRKQMRREAWKAALAREQREGVHGTKDCGMEQSARAVFVPCDCGCGRQCCAHCGTDLGFVQEKPRQEAPGAVAALVATWREDAEKEDARYEESAGFKCGLQYCATDLEFALRSESATTPPVPVDVRVVDEAMLERGLHAAREASDARLPRYSVVRAILEAALLDGQPAGVES